MSRRSLLLLVSVFVMALITGLVVMRGPAGKVIHFATGKSDGAYYAFGTGLNEALAKESSHLSLMVKESSGSVENLRLLDTGQAGLALIQNGLRGDGRISVVARTFEEVVHLLVKKNSEITRLEQLRGKRVCVGLAESGTRAVATQLLSHYGISEKEYTSLETNPTRSAEDLLEGKADVFIMVTALRAPLIEELLATGQVRFLSLGKPGQPGNIAHGIHEHFPHLSPFTIPEHAYASGSREHTAQPEAAVAALSVSSLLVCRSDLAAHDVRRLTSHLFKHRDTLMRHAPDSRHMRELTDKDVFAYPVHAGAEAFYLRKDPGFLVKYADVLALMLTLVVTFIGMLSGLQRWAESRRKNRIDTYYERVNAIIETLHESAGESAHLDEAERQLRRLNREAFRDLANEKLRANESFRIFQTLFESGLSEIQWRRDH